MRQPRKMRKTIAAMTSESVFLRTPPDDDAPGLLPTIVSLVDDDDTDESFVVTSALDIVRISLVGDNDDALNNGVFHDADDVGKVTGDEVGVPTLVVDVDVVAEKLVERVEAVQSTYVSCTSMYSIVFVRTTISKPDVSFSFTSFTKRAISR